MSKRASIRKLINQIRGGETGSALVETALTLPVFVVMLLGSVQFGQIAYSAIETSNAARAGAQYAGMNGGGFNDPSGITAAARADAYDTYTPHPTKFTVTSLSPTCTCSDATGTCSVSGSVGSSPGIYACTKGKAIITVKIQTTATYPTVINIPGLFSTGTVTLHGYAEQEVLH